MTGHIKVVNPLAVDEDENEGSAAAAAQPPAMDKLLSSGKFIFTAPVVMTGAGVPKFSELMRSSLESNKVPEQITRTHAFCVFQGSVYMSTGLSLVLAPRLTMTIATLDLMDTGECSGDGSVAAGVEDCMEAYEASMLQRAGSVLFLIGFMYQQRSRLNGLNFLVVSGVNRAVLVPAVMLAMWWAGCRIELCLIFGLGDPALNALTLLSLHGSPIIPQIWRNQTDEGRRMRDDTMGKRGLAVEEEEVGVGHILHRVFNSPVHELSNSGGAGRSPTHKLLVLVGVLYAVRGASTMIAPGETEPATVNLKSCLELSVLLTALLILVPMVLTGVSAAVWTFASLNPSDMSDKESNMLRMHGAATLFGGFFVVFVSKTNDVVSPVFQTPLPVRIHTVYV